MKSLFSFLLLLTLAACGNPHLELDEGETITPPLDQETRVEDNTDENGDVTVEENPEENGSGTEDDGDSDNGDVDHHQDQGQREKVALIQDLTRGLRLPYERSGRSIKAEASGDETHGLVFTSDIGSKRMDLSLDGKEYLLRVYDCHGFVIRSKMTKAKHIRIGSRSTPICHIALTTTGAIEVKSFGWKE